MGFAEASPYRGDRARATLGAPASLPACLFQEDGPERTQTRRQGCRRSQAQSFSRSSLTIWIRAPCRSIERLGDWIWRIPFSQSCFGSCMIVLHQLTKRFGAQVAVAGLSFEVPAGQIVGFLGPNGAGKSTTLKMLTGMIEPTDGTATVCGFDLRRETLEVKRRVGFVPESGAVFESLTGLEYLEMVAALYGIPEEHARERIRQFIAFFDLSFETLTDKLLGAYSKGMRRKVVITAALLHNPPVVFFDEPLDGLDANAAVGFKALIQTLAREGKTIVYSSHVLDVVERVCDRVIIIDKGRVLVDGRPDELVAAGNAGTLERLFTQLTGGGELERRAEDFARTFRT